MNTLEVNPSEYHFRLKLDRRDIFSPDSWLSKSTVFELYQSSLYKWRYFERTFKTTDAMTWGSLVDCLITAPDDFAAQFAVSPFDSFRTKDAKEWKAEKNESGVAIVTEDLITKAKQATQHLTETHEVAAEIINNSAKQVVMLNKIQTPFSDKPINLKALADFVPNNKPYLADLKTTNDFTPNGFAKTIAKYGYHVQASHYLDMWNAANPDDQRDRFLIIWQDSKAPYEVAISEIPQSDIFDGRDLFTHLLGKIIRAAEKDHFPMAYQKPILVGRSSFGAVLDGEEIDGHGEAPII